MGLAVTAAAENRPVNPEGREEREKEGETEGIEIIQFYLGTYVALGNVVFEAQLPKEAVWPNG